MSVLAALLGVALGLAIGAAVDAGQLGLAFSLAIVGPFLLGLLWVAA